MVMESILQMEKMVWEFTQGNPKHYSVPNFYCNDWWVEFDDELRWLFTESVSKQSTQLIVKLNSSLRQKLGTFKLEIIALFLEAVSLLIIMCVALQKVQWIL